MKRDGAEAMNLTGQPIYQKGQIIPKVRKPIRQISDRKKRERKSDEGKAGLDRMGQVANMPCCICHEYGMQQLSDTYVHHCIHGRYSSKRSPDSMTIPLCGGHHNQEFGDTSKIALHNEPERWKAEYGEDTRWISWTEERLSA